MACRALVVCQRVDEDGLDPADKNNLLRLSVCRRVSCFQDVGPVMLTSTGLRSVTGPGF